MIKALVVVLLSLRMAATAEEASSIRGEVALEYSPFCSFFVVRTQRGFSLLSWRGGLEVFSEGDLVEGPLHRHGAATIGILDHGEMEAMIEDWGVDLKRAQNTFYSRCKLYSPPSEQPDHGKFSR